MMQNIAINSAVDSLVEMNYMYTKLIQVIFVQVHWQVAGYVNDQWTNRSMLTERQNIFITKIATNKLK